MYEISIEREFCARHTLEQHDGSKENMHEHKWQITVGVTCDELDSMDIVMDFHELEKIADDVIGRLDGKVLNELVNFASVNPSAERVARHIYDAIARQLENRVKLSCVTVTEAPGCKAAYYG